MSRRTHSRIAVATTWLLVGVVACMADTTYGQSNLSVQDRDHEAMQGLEQPVNIDYFNTPLDEILYEWSRDTGLQFQVHFCAEDEGVDAKTLINARLANVRLAGVLKDMLEPHNCTWLVRDGVIYVVSEDYAVEHPVTRVIDCTTILATIQPSEHLVEPDSWEENGGTGRIMVLNGKLVVVSTNEIIRQVEQLLEQLGN